MLLSQLAFTPSAADEASFEEYRVCVLQHVLDSTLASTDAQIVENAREACQGAQMAAGFELALADVEFDAEGSEVAVDADSRMKLMELELTADAIAELVARRKGSRTDAQD